MDFLLPDIGEGLTEAEIVNWLVAEGETVRLDQPIVEIETDKALMEIPTPFAGVLVAHGAAEGTVLAVGDVLVTIQTVDELGADREESVPAAEPAPIVGTLSEDAVDLTPRTDGADAVWGESTVQALPIVRKLAGDLGVDLTTVTGTGLDGQITRDDVRAAAPGGEGQGETASPADQQPELIVAADEPVAQHEAPAAPEPGETVALSRMRRTIAERVSASWREIPHVTTFAAADVTRLMTSRTALKRRRNAPVSIDAMLVKAVVTALGRHRVFSARLEGESLVYPERIDIGVAVDTDEGLMVVVVEEPGHRDLVELSAEITRLSDSARAGRYR